MDGDTDSIRAGIETIDLNAVNVDAEAIAVVPAELALTHHILPIRFQEGLLTCAVGDLDLDLMDRATGLLVHAIDAVDAVEFRVACPEHLVPLIRHHYAE